MVSGARAGWAVYTRGGVSLWRCANGRWNRFVLSNDSARTRPRARLSDTIEVRLKGWGADGAQRQVMAYLPHQKAVRVGAVGSVIPNGGIGTHVQQQRSRAPSGLGHARSHGIEITPPGVASIERHMGITAETGKPNA